MWRHVMFASRKTSRERFGLQDWMQEQAAALPGDGRLQEFTCRLRRRIAGRPRPAGPFDFAQGRLTRRPSLHVRFTQRVLVGEQDAQVAKIVSGGSGEDGIAQGRAGWIGVEGGEGGAYRLCASGARYGAAIDDGT